MDAIAKIGKGHRLVFAAVAVLAVAILYYAATQRYQTTHLIGRAFTITDRLTGHVQYCNLNFSSGEMTCRDATTESR